MIVKDGWAHFYRNGEEVWTCNVHYAAANFVIHATKTMLARAVYGGAESF
ncbi:hypothetical protein [Burkholderia gladioli]